MTTLPPRHVTHALSKMRERKILSQEGGAGNETRTRDLNLGKVALYQLSYSRKKRSPHYSDIAISVKKMA